MKYEFHPAALVEYEAAIAYYNERDPDAARRFVEVVEDAIERILEAPTRWRILDADVRRCLTRVYPYGVLYSIERDSVVICSVVLAGFGRDLLVPLARFCAFCGKVLHGRSGFPLPRE